MTFVTAGRQAFRPHFRREGDLCKPADPETKGLVERLYDYLYRSILSGHRFASTPGFQQPAVRRLGCGYLSGL